MKKICVQGLGFVGAAMAAAVSQARDAFGHTLYMTVGVDLNSPAGLARVEAINAGRFPFETGDASLAAALAEGRDKGNLRASVDAAEYEDCDIVVVDVHLDVDFDVEPPTAKFEGFSAAIETLARRIRQDCLILIETTVPPGTTESLVRPIVQRIFAERGLDPEQALIAHSYERVMPGVEYLSSITNFWRVYAGLTPPAADACREFLESFIDTDRFPLTRLNRPAETETAKLMENSFRALNIAFVDEWSRFAERAGLDMMSIIAAIRMRPTHRNIMLPGFGVGGYCLTKDPLLPAVGAREFFGIDDIDFSFCRAAVDTNQAMPRATVAMLRNELGGLAGKKVLLMGATYRQDVADTRYSPSSDFARWVEEAGAQVDVHDPLVSEMEGFDRPVSRSMPRPGDYDAAVFAVGHSAYRGLEAADWLDGATPLVLDANAVLTRAQLDAFAKAGCKVKAIGRGDL